MTTISAVELRNNMREIFRRVHQGEEVAVTYRDEPAVILSARSQHSDNAEHMAGLEALLALPRRSVSDNSDVSFKDLYHRHLDEKYRGR